MAIAAGKAAMENAGVDPASVDLLLIATVTPDYRLPSLACTIQESLGMTNAVAFDIVSACTGFINGLSIANAYFASGQHRRALIIGAEKLSTIVNYEDRNTCVLFGDAAGAVIVEATDNGSGVLASFMKSDGQYRPWLWTEVGGSRHPYNGSVDYEGRDKILMNGKEIFKVAVREMWHATERVMEGAAITKEDIDLFIPHQANIRIIEAMQKRLGLSDDKVYLNIDRFGNTSAASIPLALDEANRAGRISSGDTLVMTAFGGGLIWGATAVRW